MTCACTRACEIGAKMPIACNVAARAFLPGRAIWVGLERFRLATVRVATAFGRALAHRVNSVGTRVRQLVRMHNLSAWKLDWLACGSWSVQYVHKLWFRAVHLSR